MPKNAYGHALTEMRAREVGYPAWIIDPESATASAGRRLPTTTPARSAARARQLDGVRSGMRRKVHQTFGIIPIFERRYVVATSDASSAHTELILTMVTGAYRKRRSQDGSGLLSPSSVESRRDLQSFTWIVSFSWHVRFAFRRTSYGLSYRANPANGSQ